MTTTELAADFLRDAAIIAEEARESLARGHWHRAVRKSQEAAEPALKGLLRWLGVEHPKVHRLGGVLRGELDRRGADPVRARRIAALADVLAEKREIAFYGSPDGRPASAIFERPDAENALSALGEILSFVREATAPASTTIPTVT